MSTKPRYKALTLVEIVLVLGIMAIIGTISYATLVTYHMTTVIDSELRILVSNIQSARQAAIGNSTGSDFSIKFLSNQYVLFPGVNYAETNPANKEFNLDSTVIVSTTFGSDIVIFNNFDGRVANPGSITISGGGFSKQVTINKLGLVEDIN